MITLNLTAADLVKLWRAIQAWRRARRRHGDGLELKNRGETSLYPHQAKHRGEGEERLYAQWGLWAGRGDKTLFEFHLTGSYSLGDLPCPPEADAQVVERLPHTPFVDANYVRDGERTNSNPVSGAAIWTGRIRGFDHDTGEPLEGTVFVKANFAASTLDVSLKAGRHVWKWPAVLMKDGKFYVQHSGTYVSGDFFGEGHEGAAGLFGLDAREGPPDVPTYWGVGGVFGALRETEQ